MTLLGNGYARGLIPRVVVPQILAEGARLDPNQSAEPDYFPDGEKIPEKDLARIFRWPPEMRAAPKRNTLVVGARGSGKTTLFRYLASQHSGLAIHLNLMQEFQSIEKRADAAIPEPEPGSLAHSRIAGMAVSLIALAIADACCQSASGLDASELMPCLPRSVRRPGRFLDAQVVEDLREATTSSQDDEFAALYQNNRLKQFVEHVASASSREGSQLLLLLDRPESTSAAALDPAVRLLDQSARYVALLGVRPAFLSPTVAHGHGLPRSGDHYEVVQLGTSPRSSAWQTFMHESVAAQFPNVLESYPTSTREHLIWLARDSARTAVQIVYNIQSRASGSFSERFEQAAKMERDAQLTMCRSNLQSYHHDFGAVIADTRSRANAGGVLTGPVVVDWTPAKEELFPELSRTERLITEGLRLGALCMPEGESWTPGLRQRRVEFPPLFMWKPGTAFASGSLTRPVPLHQDESELWASKGRPRAMTVFIVFDPHSDTGGSFRQSFEDHATERSRLGNLTVRDAQFDGDGAFRDESWDSIRGSRIIVADLTSWSPSTLYQLGFAWGLGKPIIPAVHGPTAHIPVPEWLTTIPLQYFGNDLDLGQLVDRLASMLGSRTETKLQNRTHGAPGLLIWINPSPQDVSLVEAVEHVVARELLHPAKSVDVPKTASVVESLASSPSADEVMAANLLVAWLDGTAADAYLAFVCGALSADPMVGGIPMGNHWAHGMPRRALVIERPGAGTKAMADVVRQCPIARIVRSSDLISHVEEFARDYLLWENPSP